MDKNTEDELYGKPLDLPESEKHKPASPHHHSKKPWKKRIITLSVLIIVLSGGYAIYWFVQNNDSDDDAASSVIVGESSEVNDIESLPSTDGVDVTNDFAPVQHRTTNPRMEFSYPDTWSLDDEGDDVTLRSPSFRFTAADGQVIEDGFFQVYIRQGAREADSSYIGRAVAALPSQAITYDNPATDQRETTFLQLFGLDTSANLAFVLIAGNFELQAGDTLGPDFGSDGDSYIIAGGYRSADLEDDLQAHPVPIDYFQSTNAYQQALDTIKSLRLL